MLSLGQRNIETPIFVGKQSLNCSSTGVVKNSNRGTGDDCAFGIDDTAADRPISEGDAGAEKDQTEPGRSERFSQRVHCP